MPDPTWLDPQGHLPSAGDKYDSTCGCRYVWSRDGRWVKYVDCDSDDEEEADRG